MVEGWIVQESLVYIAEWIAQFDKESPMLQRLGEDERLMVEVLQSEWMGCSKKRSIIFSCCITWPWRNGSMHTNVLWKKDMLRVAHIEHPNVKGLEQCSIHQNWRCYLGSCLFDGCMMLSPRRLEKGNVSTSKNGNFCEVEVIGLVFFCLYHTKQRKVHI